ncbi:MAG: enoyl-CoA hydratase/isomerase family protein, partial [Proteobacteria bacterium]|nr:enoyl-CoA hydratase/isomerase family protein [Pseudomonadota bacterium]
MALAISCDLRVCGTSSMFYVPEIERGMNMSWQSVPWMVSAIGPSKTKRLFVLAEKIDAETAQNWDLVDEIAPDCCTLERAMGFARRAA